jgi:hypothetical protein
LTDDLARARRVHAAVLLVLLAAFLGRVAAQLIQAVRPVDWLPPFDAWHSATLPYGGLLLLQAATVVLCLWAITGLLGGRTNPRRGLGRVLLGIGALYALLMGFRLLAGWSFLAEAAWFRQPLATMFHLVLAAFVLTLARFHLRAPGGSTPRRSRLSR